MATRRVSALLLAEVTKSKKFKLDQLTFGARLVTQTGYSIAELHQKAVIDRFLLARQFLKSANELHARADYRSAISRSYYCLYHSFRCVIFCVYGGDDHEEHGTLPKHIPADFPDSAIWENDLKDARARRNEADYNPYPRELEPFKMESEILVGRATTLLPVARLYLRRKGCVI